MRKVEIDAILNPAEGLTIYATDEQAVYLRKSLVWEKQAPFSLPYYGEYNIAPSAFRIVNNNQFLGKAISGSADIGTGVYGYSMSGRGILGISNSVGGIGGVFENRAGGRAIYCEEPMDILDDVNDPLVRFAGADRVYKVFIQLAGTDMKIGTLASNDLGNFMIRTNGSDRVVVRPDGKMVLGSPTGSAPIGNHSLALKGRVAATEFTVTNIAAWSDYVFADGYKLKSLEETEAFIKANKHLPNIPAAAVIEKDGFALGDMQKRMMEKIEELTLYLIDSKKEINTLKQQVATLQSKK